MKSKPALEQTVRRGLDRCVDVLDAESLSRLRQARAAALESHGQCAWYRRFDFPTWTLSASGLAAVFGIAIGLAVWLQAPMHEFQFQSLTAADEVLVEMTEAELDIELIEEIEFYDWLMLAQTDGDSP